LKPFITENHLDDKIDEETTLAVYIVGSNYNVKLYQEMIDYGAYVIERTDFETKKIVVVKFNTWDEMKTYIINEVKQAKMNAKLPKLKEIQWYATPASEVVYKRE